MAEFVTISLENNECDICHEDNGEELISYILNDRCWREQEVWSRKFKSSDDQIHRAHILCLDRWDHIMRKSFNRFNLLRRSWTGEKSRSLTKANSSSVENLNVSRTWTAIKSHSQETLNHHQSQSQSPKQRRTDTSICSSPLAKTVYTESRKTGCKDLEISLRRFSVKELQERISCYNKNIKDSSTQLIDLLQERDNLRQEIEVRRVAIEQLLKLQTGAIRSQSMIRNTGSDIPQSNSLRV